MADEKRGARRPALRRWSPIERDLRRTGGQLIAGVDEVGRGPLAGPVVACAVVMPPDARAIAGVDDSKRLTAAERERLAGKIRERALAIGLGAASVREIDRVNIYHASVLAMRRAIRRLTIAPDHVLVDGRPIRTLGVAHRAIVGGDARCFSIACASILAKVTRDRLMAALGRRHPGYRWERNAGYATADHIAGLDREGLTPHHRRSFWRTGQLVLELLPPEEGGDPGDPAAGMPDEHAGALAGEAHAEGGEALADCAPDDTEAIVLDASLLADAALDDPLLEELASGELLEAPRPRTDELIAELIRPPDEGPAAGA